MNRRDVLRMGGLAVAGAVAGCSGGAESTPTPTEVPEEPRVDMTDTLKFEPGELTIDVGQTVVWETVGSVAHSVTAYGDELPDGAAYFASGGFDTTEQARSGYPEGSVGQGETYSHTFETAGEFPYFCVPHESGMRGTVVVE